MTLDTKLPQSADLLALLQLASVAAPIMALADGPRTTRLEAAITLAYQSFESDTRHQPFLVDGGSDAIARQVAVVGGMGNFDGGLLRYDSATVVENVNGYGADFWNGGLPSFALLPLNALTRGRPYTYVDFGGELGACPVVIEITGLWGACTQLDALAREAILARAAMHVTNSAQANTLLTGGLQGGKVKRQTDDGVTVEYQSGSDAGDAPGKALRAATVGWLDTYRTGVKAWRLI